MAKTRNGIAKLEHVDSFNKSELVVEMVGGEPYEYYPLGEHIVRAVGVCGGRPTFKYTRIDVDFILSQITNDESISQIVDDFEHPHITEAAVKEAIFLAISAFRTLHHTPLPVLA